MNTKTTKNIFIVLVVFAMATIASCNLAVPAQEGSTVEVVMGGIGNPGHKSIGSEATWVKIKVMNSSGEQVSSGELSKNSDNVFKGSIHVNTSGQMTFKATAGIKEAEVGWLGEATYNVGLDTVPLTITVGEPVVASGLGNGYGPAGGKIFYDKGEYGFGWRYLEAAPSDQSAGIAWSNITGTATNFMGMGNEIGNGQGNTTAIVGQAGCTSGAAYLCDNLTLGGYSDWFLPSRYELNELYLNSAVIGHKFAWYWSSSEVSSSNAWLENFDDGGQLDYYTKSQACYVRAVRAF